MKLSPYKTLQLKVMTVLISQRGASMVEYALLVALIAMIGVAAVAIVGGEVSTAYSGVADSFTNPN
jgi:pilus assembly protein Flp/PilA